MALNQEVKIADLSPTLDYWIGSLQNYSLAQLHTKPSKESWSLGQVYVHIIGETRYYLEQVATCVTTNEHAREAAAAEVLQMFSENQFPNVRLKGPAGVTAPKQPQDKQQLLEGLIEIREAAHKLAQRTAASSFRGKTRHPGFDYLNAEQWLHYAEMHLRHHLRQKERIDAFLREHTP